MKQICEVVNAAISNGSGESVKFKYQTRPDALGFFLVTTLIVLVDIQTMVDK